MITPYGDPERGVDSCLTRGKNGPRPTLDNLVSVLSGDSRWAGRLRYNAFLADPEIDGRPLTEEDEGEAAIWADRVYGVSAPSARVGEAARLVAARSTYHPVRDWLMALRWDGKPRLDGMISRCFGGEDTALNKRIGACWLISAVARVMRPGCKVDTSPIFVGQQGAQKSSAVRALASAPWFADTPIAIGSKDAYQALRGVWIYELGELDSVKRVESSAVKAFLSSPVDRYRPPFGRYVRSYPRQVVIVGSTNEREFLRDHTGSRRFWPVDVVGRVSIPAILGDREQLWAEARARFDKGEHWWFDADMEAELRTHSEQFRESDPWEAAVASWVEGRRIGGFTTADVLSLAVRRELAQQTRWDSMRVAAILERMGFEQHRVRMPGRQVRLWGRVGVHLEAIKAQADQAQREDPGSDDPWFGRNAG